MKKLMFAAAAIVAGVAVADVTSANIVGYQNLTTVRGFNFTVPTFKAVGDKAIDIQDIQLDFGEGEATGNDNMQILGTGGEMLEQFFRKPVIHFLCSTASPSTSVSPLLI